MLSRHDFRAAPQTVQTASPVCGTKNFSSVRLYSAPQLHCTIVAGNMRRTVDFPAQNSAAIELTHYPYGGGSVLPLKALALCKRHVSNVTKAERRRESLSTNFLYRGLF